MNNIAFITYTNQNCKDIWKPYFDSLDQYASEIKSYVFSDLQNNNFKNHKFLTYEENKNYCQEFSRLLNLVEEEYVIYMQEDFILYDFIKKEKILNYKSILEKSNLSFVRLIKCGDVTQTNYVDDLYYVTEADKFHNSINSFSMQPTLWKKTDLIKLYENTNSYKFGENWSFIQNMNLLKINGLYCFNNENKRGANHHDSSVFPYIATAVVRGKWNTTEYENELKYIFDKYQINKDLRGCI